MFIFDPVFKFAITEELIEYCKETGESPNDWLPIKSNNTDTGWDVKCGHPDGVELRHGEYAIIPLGFRVFSPDGWWLKLVPRSSTFIKKNIHALYGTIDESYEGDVGFCAMFSAKRESQCDHLVGHNFIPLMVADRYNKSLYIPFGERIGQLIPVRREKMVVESISNEEFDKLCAERNASRGAGGFGSSGDA
jgi:dUTPase